MKRRSLWIALIAAGLWVSSAGAEKAGGADIVGTWYGAIAAKDGALRLALEVTADPDGKLRCTLVSLDQANARIPMDRVAFEQGIFDTGVDRLDIQISATSTEHQNLMTGLLKVIFFSVQVLQ